MRKVTILFIGILSTILVACGAVESNEVATNDIELQVASVTTGPTTEVWVQAWRGANPIVLSSGDTFSIRTALHPEVQLTETEPLEWLNDGKAYHGSILAVGEIEIILRRANGQEITGTTFYPVTDPLLLTQPAAGFTYTDESSEQVQWTALTGGNDADAVTLNIDLNSASCTPLSEAEHFAFVEAMYAVASPTSNSSNQGEGTTVADGQITFAVDTLRPADYVGTFVCDANLLVNRVGTDAAFDLNVAPQFKGPRGTSSYGVNQIRIPFTWQGN